MSSDSLTVEETNALRAKMGLPPLRSAATQQPTQHLPSHPLETEDDSAASLSHLRSELSRRKQARVASALLSAPSLSQQLSFQTGGAAAAWVERSRRVMEEERAAAEKRKQAEAERLRKQREEANQYGSAHLRGLRIAHQYDEFDADEQHSTVLVLKDKKIGDTGDDIDELVNTDLEERGRKQRLDKDNQRRKGRAWDDDMEAGLRLLGKYDEEEEKEGIVLGGGGVYGREEEERRRRRKEAEEREQRLREGWGGAAVVAQEYDMSSTTERKIDSDYKPVNFKRKAKSAAATKLSKPARSTTTAASDDWIDQLEQQALSSDAQSSTQQHQTTAQADEDRKERRVAGYLRAMQRGEEETRRRLERDREEGSETERRRRAATLQEVEEEDEELAAALAKARRATARERETQVVRVKVEGEEGKPVTVGRESEAKRMAEQIRSERETGGDETVKREMESASNGAAANGDEAMQGVEQDDGSIVFTSVSNFASGLQAVDDEDRVKRERPNGVHKDEEKVAEAAAGEKKPAKVKKETARQHVQQDESERSGWIRYDDDSNGRMDEGNEDEPGGAVKEEEDEDEDDEDEEEDEEDEPLGDEPLVSEGVAAALALAKRRAYLSSSSTSTAPTTFTLTQYDALGRELSAKEQFRALSHAFHGQGAGWNKKDKRSRRLRREVGVMRKRADMGPQEGAERALEAQKRLGQAFIVLEGNSKQKGSGADGGGGGGGGGSGGGGREGTDSVAGKPAANKRVKKR